MRSGTFFSANSLVVYRLIHNKFYLYHIIAIFSFLVNSYLSYIVYEASFLSLCFFMLRTRSLLKRIGRRHIEENLVYLIFNWVVYFKILIFVILVLLDYILRPNLIVIFKKVTKYWWCLSGLVILASRD